MKYIICFLLSVNAVAATISSKYKTVNEAIHLSVGKTEIEFRENGEILHNGKIITTDKALVQAFKELVNKENRRLFCKSKSYDTFSPGVYSNTFKPSPMANGTTCTLGCLNSKLNTKTCECE